MPFVIEFDYIAREVFLFASHIEVVINSIEDDQINIVVGTLIKDPVARDTGDCPHNG